MRSARAARSSVDPVRSRSRHHAWRWRAVAWCAWLLLAAAAMFPLRRYRVDNSIDAWLPELGSRGPFGTYVAVGWERGTVEDEDALEDALRRAPGVAFALDRRTIAPLTLAAGVTPDDLVVSRDGRYVGTFCFGAARTSDAALVRSVRSAIEQRDPTALGHVAIGGPAVFKVALDDYSQRGMPAIVCGTIAVGALALRWVTGSWAAALAAVGAVVLSQVVLLGLISWQGRAMDMSLSIVPPLMMALGFSYAAHRALRRRVAPVLIVCCVTAVAGVASSASAPLVPVRLFGVYGTIGLVLVWLATWTLVPFAAGRVPRTAWLRGGLRPLLRSIARPRPAGAAAIAVVVLAAGVAAVPSLTFSSNPLHYFPADARVRRDFDELDRRLTGMLPFQITVRGDARADATALISASTGVRKVVDVSRLVPDVPGQTLWCLADNDALPELARHRQRWHRWAEAQRVELVWRGVAAQLAAAERVVTRNAAVSIPSMCLLGGVGIWLVDRRLASIALGAVAAVLPVAAMVAVVAMARIPIGLPSLLIGAICIGLSIDDTVHLVAAASRYRSVRRATVACFRPCVGSSLTNALCASMFVMSPLAPVRQFGLLTAGAVLSGMLVNQLLVPHVLGWHLAATARAPAERAKHLAPPSAAAF